MAKPEGPQPPPIPQGAQDPPVPPAPQAPAAPQVSQAPQQPIGQSQVLEQVPIGTELGCFEGKE